jgi:hypothetical protein
MWIQKTKNERKLGNKNAKTTSEFTTQLEKCLRKSFKFFLQWTMVNENHECY